MATSELAIRKAKNLVSDYRISDGDGLYLLVKSTGSKLWRFDYRNSGKRNTMSFGKYPTVSLLEARLKRDEARKTLSAGDDPVAVSRASALTHAQQNTFGRFGEEYISRLKKTDLAENTIKRNASYVRELAAELSDRIIATILPHEILEILNRIDRTGRNSTAHRLRSIISAVFRLAILEQACTYDPTYALRGSLPYKKVRHQAAVTEERAYGRLLRSLDTYDGWFVIGSALKLMSLCYPRPIELRMAEWSAVNLDGRVWHIPEEVTKMRRPHDIPLSRQAVEIFTELKQVTGNGDLVFPQLRSRNKVISENAMNCALRYLGIESSQHCSHGFRSSASTLLNKFGFDEKVIESSLAHLDPNLVRRTYNRYSYWNERVAMAQSWADHCDRLKGAKVRDNSDII